MIEQERIEALGPAERIITTLTGMTDHMAHNRPGLVSRVQGKVGVKWEPCTYVEEKQDDGTTAKVVYALSLLPQGKGKKPKQVKTRAGILTAENRVVEGGVDMGEYRVPSDRNKLFPEVGAYLYRQIADIFEMDNDFAARWASYTFNQGKDSSEDLKVVLAAFMLVQPRSGLPIVENGEFLFFDDDYRDVGEAMFLVRGRNGREMSPKLIKRVGDFLRLPEIVEINRELGFVNSARKVPMGRYNKAVTRWLRYRERNTAMLEGLVNAGYATLVKALARRVHYKPESAAFFRILNWEQKVRYGHRTVAIGEEMVKAESWDGLTEQEVCERIMAEKIGYKRFIGLYSGGLTPAILAACMEAGSLSDRDLMLLSETLESFGLLTKEPFKSRWQAALASAKVQADQRAANIARNVKSKEAREALEDTADAATARALAKATRGLRVYCMVDKSASMDQALAKAITYLTKFLGGFPLDKLHVSVFNTQGREIVIKAAKGRAVEHAFSGHRAGGGTCYMTGLAALQHHQPSADEDALFLFVGDGAGESGKQLADYIVRTGINPVAFAYLYVPGNMGLGNRTVETAAKELGIPCFNIDEEMFEGTDPYAITRIFRDLIAATPVVKAAVAAKPRVTLIEQILKTDLLTKPSWASAA